jgi:hypothetical protein
VLSLSLLARNAAFSKTNAKVAIDDLDLGYAQHC